MAGIGETQFNVDLSNCAQEPIHIPGRIQPFAVLLAVSDPQLSIQQVSANINECCDLSADQAVGQPLSSVLLPESVELVKRRIKKQDFKDDGHFVVQSHRGPKKAFVHRRNGRLIIEIERCDSADSLAPLNLQVELAGTIARIQSSSSFPELLRTTADEVRRLTGFDGAMIYKFHEDDHGEVVAESKAPGYDSYLGLHYPASDIPPQARAIFLQNWVRMIPDVGYDPVGVFPALDPVTRTPLDLSQASSRSVSPIHIEYLENMRVKATLTISLIKDEKLWGLIACHHCASAKYVSPEIRTACEIIGRVASAELSISLQREHLKHREKLRNAREDLELAMASEPDLMSGLFKEPLKLLNLVGAQGASAAVFFESRWMTAGKAPSEDQMDAIADWLEANHADQPVFHTDQLPALFPAARDFKDVASGLLAIGIPKGERSYVLWFRPEVQQTLSWAGNPEKPVAGAPGGDGRIHPRKSFEAFKQLVSFRSVPWRQWEIEEARELRSCILALDLRRQFLKEQQARKSAEVANMQKEELLSAVSHDLKHPLSSLRLSLGLLKRLMPSDLLQKATMVLDGMQRSTDSMNRLITDLLSIAKIESGSFSLERETHSVRTIINEMLDFLMPLAGEKDIALKCGSIPETSVVKCDRERVFQVLNLIGNAIKFTKPGGTIQVDVRQNRNEYIISVSDTGPGIPKENLQLIFDRFWQARQTQRQGTGLGLAIAKGIVESHGGRIWVESELGVGTTFYFSLPGNGSSARY